MRKGEIYDLLIDNGYSDADSHIYEIDYIMGTGAMKDGEVVSDGEWEAIKIVRELLDN